MRTDAQNPRMVPRSERRPESGPEGSRGERRFFLARAPSGTSSFDRSGRTAGDPSTAELERSPPASKEHGERVELTPADAEHARVVLRLGQGDRCIGLDGAGSAWPLVVTASDRRRFEVEIAGDPVREPAPGEPGSRLPWIEVAVAMPRGARAESMIDSLVQLGAAAVTPLITERSPPAARSEGAHRRERWVRIAREACKQSGRLWELELNEPIDVEHLCQREFAAVVRLDPRAEVGFHDHLGSLTARNSTRDQPLLLAIGPEGGFTEDEERLFDAAKAARVSISPHILRVETAATSALAIAVDRFSIKL
jgi:16S rRNA (uracil1498-N3)-methyltransferase